MPIRGQKKLCKYKAIDVYSALVLYVSGLGGPTIKKILGIDRQTLYNWQDYFGQRRRKDVAGSRNRKWSDKIRNNVISLYKNGLFPYQIIKNYPGMATGTVHCWVRKAKVTRGNTIGKNNTNWRGGISRIRSSEEKKVTKWRMAVFERDGFKCQCCGQIGGELNGHHILSWIDYPAERYNVDNGITLCRDCHFYRIHKFKRRIV